MCIYINDKKINFNYYYIFFQEGIYTIKYIFKKNLSSIHFMFYNCDSITSLDFTNFNTENIIDMRYMFCNCNKLS